MKRSSNTSQEFKIEAKRGRLNQEEDETYVVPDVDHKPPLDRCSQKETVNVGIKQGSLVDKKKLKSVGPFVIGQKLGSSPVSSILQCLARIPNDPSDKFYVMKMLTLPEDPSLETKDDIQGKMLIHTEYSLLSMLENVDGVVQCHGLYKDVTHEEMEVEDESGGSKIVSSGKTNSRICLVLDCLYPHEYSVDSKKFVNLQKYVIQEKQLSERTSMKIFYHIVQVIDELHKRNIVHRDLKLGNLILNRVTKKVTLVNFCLGKHLLNDSDLLRDQRGSPAYISPDVLSGNPYQGKPSDIWSLGVILYTMIYGQFPFYDPDPRSLLTKIRNGSFNLPNDVKVSQPTQDLISQMLNQNPKTRLTSAQVLNSVKDILGFRMRAALFQNLQVVPDLESESKSKSCYKSVVIRLEALKHLTRRPANSNVFVTSISTSVNASTNSHLPPRPSNSLRRILMGPPSMPPRINTVHADTEVRTLSSTEMGQLRRRIATQHANSGLISGTESSLETSVIRRGSL